MEPPKLSLWRHAVNEFRYAFRQTLLVDSDRAADEIGAMRGAGAGDMSTEEILALTRR
jgi:hypothetical protein